MLTVALLRRCRASRVSSSISSISISSSFPQSLFYESARSLSSTTSAPPPSLELPPPPPPLPARTAAVLAGAPVRLSCVFVPGAGRGLVIGGGAGNGVNNVRGGTSNEVEDDGDDDDEIFIEEGTTLLREAPLAAIPLASHVDGGGGEGEGEGGSGGCVCYGCLRPLRPPRTTDTSSSSSSSSLPPPRPLPEGTVTHFGASDDEESNDGDDDDDDDDDRSSCRQSRRRSRSRRTFCSQACLDASLLDFYALESRVPRGWEELDQFCRRSGERFPRLVARIFSRSIFFSDSSDAFDDGFDDGDGISEKTAEAKAAAAKTAARDAADALRALCFARVSHPYPPSWVESHAAFVSGLGRWWKQERRRRQSGKNAAVADDKNDGDDSHYYFTTKIAPRLVPLEGWVAALARVHLNAFRVDAPWPATTREEMMAAMLASLSGGGRSGAPRGGKKKSSPSSPNPGDDDDDGGGGEQQEEGEQAGTAVYAAASLANHSCLPSARPSFPRGDATLALVAARALSSSLGEEVTVSYVDESLPLRERRRALEYGYGFFCRCERCVAEEKEEEEEKG